MQVCFSFECKNPKATGEDLRSPAGSPFSDNCSSKPTLLLMCTSRDVRYLSPKKQVTKTHVFLLQCSAKLCLALTILALICMRDSQRNGMIDSEKQDHHDPEKDGILCGGS